MLSQIAAVILLGLGLWGYLKFIRPKLHEKPKLYSFYQGADGFWAKVWGQIKKVWDIAAAAVLIVLPEIPGILTDIGAIDFTGLVPAETAKLISKAIAVALIVVRVIYLRAPKAA